MDKHAYSALYPFTGDRCNGDYFEGFCPKSNRRVTENEYRGTEKVTENEDGVTEKLIEKSIENGERFTENRIAILRLIAENPYISKSELADSIGISVTAISNNIKAMRNKFLRRVGADKGGFWEVIE